ncbi:hypothetical protein GCM10010109_59400 [Actinoplanes campanulatus]|nr:hypothetical protein GCM10010109_59400 [Actinoplanes campanulatus]
MLGERTVTTRPGRPALRGRAPGGLAGKTVTTREWTAPEPDRQERDHPPSVTESEAAASE